MSEMKRGLQWNTMILSAGPTSRRNLHYSVIYPQNSWGPDALGLKSCKPRFFQPSVCRAIGCTSRRRPVSTSKIESRTGTSFARGTHCRGRRGSGLAGSSLTSPLQSTPKYGQYHRPIARPILFWLDGDSFMSPGGTHASLRSGDLPPRRGSRR